MPLEGKTVLERVVERVRYCKRVDEVFVLTTFSRQDLQLVRLCAEREVRVFCGSEEDVLDRFYQAAKLIGPAHVVRITADCPLLDTTIVDQVIALHLDHGSDYCSNTLVERYPDGEDVEIFTFEALQRAWQQATLTSEREHVTPFIRKHPELFKHASLELPQDLSHMRWTLDYDDDYDFVKKVYNALYPNNHFFGMYEILKLLESEPTISKVNARHIRNEGYQKSLREDRSV